MKSLSFILLLLFLICNFGQAYTITYFSNATNRSTLTTGMTIEDFEDATFIPGLSFSGVLNSQPAGYLSFWTDNRTNPVRYGNFTLPTNVTTLVFSVGDFDYFASGFSINNGSVYQWTGNPNYTDRSQPNIHVKVTADTGDPVISSLQIWNIGSGAWDICNMDLGKLRRNARPKLRAHRFQLPVHFVRDPVIPFQTFDFADLVRSQPRAQPRERTLLLVGRMHDSAGIEVAEAALNRIQGIRGVGVEHRAGPLQNRQSLFNAPVTGNQVLQRMVYRRVGDIQSPLVTDQTFYRKHAFIVSLSGIDTCDVHHRFSAPYAATS